MHFIRLIISLCFSICWGQADLYGQIFRSESQPLSLNFGFPKLAIADDLRYTDENGNNVLEPTESAFIRFTIINEGKYPALGIQVTPEDLNDLGGFTLPAVVDVGDIGAGEKKEVRVGVIASNSPTSGTASVIFYVEENGAKQSISVVYSLNVSSQFLDD